MKTQADRDLARAQIEDWRRSPDPRVKDDMARVANQAIDYIETLEPIMKQFDGVPFSELDKLAEPEDGEMPTIELPAEKSI